MRYLVVAVALLPALAGASLSFSAPVMCSGQTGEEWSTGDGCIGPDNTLYEVWTNTMFGSGEGGIYFARSTDTNRTWSPNITVHYWDPTWVHAEYGRPTIAATGDTLYCTYWVRPEHALDSFLLYCSRSDTRGASWSIFDVSISGSASGVPYGTSLAVGPDGAVNLAFATKPTPYQSTRLYFCRSTDCGVTFSPPLLLPGNVDICDMDDPSLVVTADNRVLVAARYWFATAKDLYRNNLYLLASTDSGRTFDTTNLTPVLGQGFSPRLHRGRFNRLYLCYEDLNDQVKFSCSTDGGATWQSPVTVVSDEAGWTSGACDDRIIVGWNDDPNWESYFRTSADGGTTWSGPAAVWQVHPFPGDWLSLDFDVGGDVTIFSMHPEPGNVEAQYCSHAVWPAGVTEPEIRPRQLGPVLAASPNPFVQATLLSLPGTNRSGSIQIRTPLGQLVRELDASGTATWDGTDAGGRQVPAGVYVAHRRGLGSVRLVRSR